MYVDMISKNRLWLRGRDIFNHLQDISSIGKLEKKRVKMIQYRLPQ